MSEVLPAGTTVAGYRIDDLLGVGGMGVVYEATQLSLDRKVALKILAPGLSADSAFRARFRREGLIQARVEHPNIVTVYEAGEHESQLFLAMRLVRGPSLMDMLHSGVLDVPRTLGILRAVADALDSAHEAGLIHRDVKPHNILVSQRDHPYLADFGITKNVEDTGLTRTGQFMGSLDYIAPEQIRGEQVTASCDIYALAAVLFECLVGMVPFAKESEAAVLYAHVAEPPPKVTDYRPHLPGSIDKVISRGMAKEPSERPSTAAALIEAARESVELGLNSVADNPDASREPRSTWVGRVDTSETPDTTRSRVSRDSEPYGQLTGTARDIVTEDPEPIVVSDPPPTGGDVKAHEGPRHPRRQIRPAPFALVAGAMAIVGSGYAIGHGSWSSAGTRSHRTLTAGVASITLTGRWPAAVAPLVPGLLLHRTTAARSPTGDVLALGILPEAQGKYLLPASFEKNLQAKARPDGVRLGAASAYRYKGLHAEGFSRPFTLMLVPTTAGAVALLCVAHANSGTPGPACEAAVGTMRLSGAEPLPLGPNPEYARQLSLAIGRARGAATSEHALVQARTQAGQARLSSTLAGIYATATKLLAQAKPGPDAAVSNARLLDAFQLTAREYSAMAGAARADQSGRFHEAALQRLASQRSIRSVLATLRSDGYR